MPSLKNKQAALRHDYGRLNEGRIVLIESDKVLRVKGVSPYVLARCEFGDLYTIACKYLKIDTAGLDPEIARLFKPPQSKEK